MFIKQMVTEPYYRLGTISRIGTEKGTRNPVHREPPSMSEDLCKEQILSVSALLFYPQEGR